MERLRVAVVDRSPTVRETVAIILPEYEVLPWAPEQFAEIQGTCGVDLVVAEQGAIDDATVALKAPGVPVVWLRPDPRQSGGSSLAVGRSFTAAELRQKIQAALALRPAEPGSLAVYGFPPPLLPAALVPLFVSAARSSLPVWISGEFGTGRARLARALHASSGSQHFLAVPGNQCGPELEAQFPPQAAGTVTLYIEDVEDLPPRAQAWLLDILEAGRQSRDRRGMRVRVLCSTTLSRDEIEARQMLRGELLYALTAFLFPLPPLRERRAEIPEIVRFVARRLSEEASLPPGTFTPSAFERLQNYLWFGNLTELEAVLARTLARVPHRPIDAADLCFGYEPIPATSAATSESRSSGPRLSPEPSHQIEVLVNELAHEIRNPLVVIKTISQHLERLLESASGREEVAQLAGEAVEKLDALFETLLRYARFREPNREPTSVNAIVAQTLGELAPLLSERRILVHYRPPNPQPIVADREQLAFALQSLLQAIVRDVEEGTTITIEPGPDPHSLQLQFPPVRGGVTQRLSTFVDSAGNTERAEPLGLLIARSLLQRNGGSVLIRDSPDQEVTTMLLRFPANAGAKTGYGETPSFDRR